LPDGKKRAYTTVLSVMQVMEKKGLLGHKRDGLTHVYRPTVTRKQILAPLLRNLVNRVFGGSATEAVQHLVSAASVDDEELAEIRQMLAETPPDGDARTNRGRASK